MRNYEIATAEQKDILYEKQKRRLVWVDEFDGKELDSSKWSFLKTMSNPDIIYINDPRHARLEDSMLHMQFHKDKGGLTNCFGIVSKKNMIFKYGYLEIRAKLPFRHGAWPSFWLLTNTPFHNEKIGYIVEIDIFEVFSSTNRISGNIHKWGHNGIHEMLPGEEDVNGRHYIFEDAENLSNEFHNYGFSWDKQYMRWFVDGKCYYEFRIDDQSSFKSNDFDNVDGFHEPAYIVFNNEVFTEGLSWYPEGAAINKDDEFPIDYYIDWVRLYQDSSDEEIYYTESILSKY